MGVKDEPLSLRTSSLSDHLDVLLLLGAQPRELLPLLRESAAMSHRRRPVRHVLRHLQHLNRLPAPQLLPLGRPVRQAVVRELQQGETVLVERLDVGARGDERLHDLSRLTPVHRRGRRLQLHRCSAVLPSSSVAVTSAPA